MNYLRHFAAALAALIIHCAADAADPTGPGILLYREPPTTYIELIRYTILREKPVISDVLLPSGGTRQVRNAAIVARLEHPPTNLSLITQAKANETLASIQKLIAAYPQYRAPFDELATKWQNALSVAKAHAAKMEELAAHASREAPLSISLEIAGVRYNGVTLTGANEQNAAFSHADGTMRVPIAQLTREQIALLNSTSRTIRIEQPQKHQMTPAQLQAIPPSSQFTSTETVRELGTLAPQLPPSATTARIDADELWRVLSIGDFTSATNLLENAPSLVTEKLDGGDTLLMRAVWNNQREIVEFLLRHKADVSEKDQRGWTALHFSKWNLAPDGPAIVAALLKAGADPNAKTDTGETPLHFAVSAGNSDEIDFLITHGARVDERDNKGQTPLYACVHPNIARQLIDAGAAVNVQDGEGQTPLHHATLSAALMQVLFEHGARHDIRDKHGRTALHEAAARRSRNAVKLLLDHGADASARDAKGAKPSYIASDSGDAALAEAIAEADRAQRAAQSLATNRTTQPELPKQRRPYWLWMSVSIAATVGSGGCLLASRRRAAIVPGWRKLTIVSAAAITAGSVSSGLAAIFYVNAPDSVQPPQVILHRYLDADSWQERLPFVRDSQRVQPLMSLYYGESSHREQFSIGQPEWDSIGNLVLSVTFPERKLEQPYYLVRTEQGYKVDWEASTGHCTMSWVDLKSKKPRFPVRFRAYGRLEDFYAGSYVDGLKWMCVELTSETGDRLDVYARRHSDCGEKLYDALRDGSNRRVVIDLLYGDGEFEAAGFVAKSWVVPP